MWPVSVSHSPVSRGWFWKFPTYRWGHKQKITASHRVLNRVWETVLSTVFLSVSQMDCDCLEL